MQNWTLALSIACLSCVAAASTPSGPSSMLRSGLDCLYNLQLEQACASSDSVILAWPARPQGYLLKSMVRLYSHAFAGSRRGMENEFMALNQKAIGLARHGDNGLTKSDRRFFEGVAYANLALYQGMASNWLRAFQYARRARELHREVIKGDSSYFDAYLAPGLFDYYAATLPRMVRFVSRLAGLQGEAESGLEQIAAAYAQGRLARVEAGTFLANFRLERGEYEAAVAIYETLARQYPQNPYFKLHLARTLLKLERYSEMQQQLDLAVRLTDENNSHARALVCYYMGRAAMIRGNFVAAARLFRQVAALTAGLEMVEISDGWLPGESLFRLAECDEFLGLADSARHHYAAAAKLEAAPASVVEGSRNRLLHPRSDLELTITRRGNRLAWRVSPDAISEFTLFSDSLKLAGVGPEFWPEIEFILGRANLSLERRDIAMRLFEGSLSSPHAGRVPWLIPFAHYYLSQCLQFTGQPTAAASHLDMALRRHDYAREKRLRILVEKRQRQ